VSAGRTGWLTVGPVIVAWAGRAAFGAGAEAAAAGVATALSSMLNKTSRFKMRPDLCFMGFFSSLTYNLF
jgi:hypothetical protein